MFGSTNDRVVKKLLPAVRQITAMEPAMQALTDEQLQAKTAEFRARIATALEGITEEKYREEAQKQALKEILPEAFAVVREVGRRVLNMRHFDVQLIGGIVLHQGKIAEMKTGEGKTLVATLPCYLNALLGQGVHVITVNDYLAKRDAEWMGKIHEFLGLTVGVIVHDLSDEQRREAYAADITYGTNNEFGFDYLRDNMKFELSDCVQRRHHYAIVDEVDSILIDEARTPLIISGPTDQTTDKYVRVNRIVPSLEEGEEIEHGETKILTGDYVVDEKHKTISITDEGWEKVEKLLGIGNIADVENWELKHHVEVAVKAHSLYKRDVQYVVKDGEIIIVDEFTGRMMPGRRWSDGLHQAVEAKEGVTVKGETQTLATITIQNYFRMYEKLAGMTGTAETEENEFYSIYKLEVAVIPTNKPMRRQDHPDQIYKTRREKYNAVAEEVAEIHAAGWPVLIGTTSVEVSETLSRQLKRRGLPHEVLNAKYHQREAEIVAGAGRKSAITIATNMAGRGTDIKLDPSLDLATDEAGLHIIGTERHESRRIDRQLRGRSGRQGDPGVSRFFMSLEDDLMRLFGSDRIARMMDKSGAEEGEVITGKMITMAIEGAQKRVEMQNFEARKRLLEYDDVMNQQREIIYSTRLFALERGEELKAEAIKMIRAATDRTVRDYLGTTERPEDFDRAGMRNALLMQYLVGPEAILDPVEAPSLDTVVELARAGAEEAFERKVAYLREFGATIGVPDVELRVLSQVMLAVLDEKWKDHLYDLDQLRNAIQYRAYGQRDPLVEYKKEAFEMFEDLLRDIQATFAERYLKIQVSADRPAPPPPRLPPPTVLSAPSSDDLFAGPPTRTVGAPPPRISTPLGAVGASPLPGGAPVGRNDPCPCGSGKKYKKCHGATA
ncbi:MAG: preprotein translocase subunit SecA [Gemmatimonadales bacterium]